MRIVTIILLVLAATPAGAQVATGDAKWVARAEGARGAVAAAGPIDAAIAAYATALERDPDDLEARWKLLRALRFRAAYVEREPASKKSILEKARAIARDGIRRLDARLRDGGVADPERQSADDLAPHIRRIRGGGELHYWSSVVTGEWALVFGKLAAARQGAADDIRRSATIAYRVDPALEGGGGARVLGRLHDQTPRIPFITGWASSEEAIRFLKLALEQTPNDKVTQVFLAEALWGKKKRTEAIAILRRVLERPDDPAFAVEHAAAREDARRLLSEWGAS